MPPFRVVAFTYVKVTHYRENTLGSQNDPLRSTTFVGFVFRPKSVTLRRI